MGRFYLRDRIRYIFSVAGKFCLAHGLRQLTRDTKSDVNCLQTTLTRRNEKLRMTFGASRYTMLIAKKCHDVIKGRFLLFQVYRNFANLFSKLSVSTFYKKISKFQQKVQI